MTDISLSLIRSLALAAILSLNYFLSLPANFLIITGAALILSLVIVAWDIYERKHCEVVDDS